MTAATRETDSAASLWDSERQRSAKLFHDLTRKALHMEANLVAPDTEVDAARASASGEAFSAKAYRCPR